MKMHPAAGVSSHESTHFSNAQTCWSRAKKSPSPPSVPDPNGSLRLGSSPARRMQNEAACGPYARNAATASFNVVFPAGSLSDASKALRKSSASVALRSLIVWIGYVC